MLLVLVLVLGHRRPALVGLPGSIPVRLRHTSLVLMMGCTLELVCWYWQLALVLRWYLIVPTGLAARVGIAEVGISGTTNEHTVAWSWYSGSSRMSSFTIFPVMIARCVSLLLLLVAVAFVPVFASVRDVGITPTTRTTRLGIFPFSVRAGATWIAIAGVHASRELALPVLIHNSQSSCVVYCGATPRMDFNSCAKTRIICVHKHSKTFSVEGSFENPPTKQLF